VEDLRREGIENQGSLDQKQAELDQKQAEKRAAMQHAQSDEQFELREAKLEERADVANQLNQAQGDFREERQNHAAENERRIHAVDTRANELLVKSKRLHSSASAKFDGAWRVYTSSRFDAVNSSRHLQEAPDSEWLQEKPATEAALVRLEESVELVSKNF
jgi:hypothetical protein